MAYFHRNGAEYVDHPLFDPLSVEDWKDHEGEGEGEEEEELQQQQQLPPQQQQLQPPPEEEEEEEVQHMGVVTPESVLTDLVMLTKVIKNHIIPLKDMDEDEVMESGVCYPTMAPGECILVGDSSDGGVILQSSGTELKSKVSFLRY